MSSKKIHLDVNLSTRSSLISKERIMSITPEQREMVAGELKRFATDLKLSEDQKQKLHGFLSEVYHEESP
jgi:hypothetical protein